MKKNLNKKGFTLIEAVVVVAIITIVTGVTVISVGSSMERYQQSANEAANRQFPEAMVLTRRNILDVSNNQRVREALNGRSAGYNHSDDGSVGGDSEDTLGNNPAPQPSQTTPTQTTPAATTPTATTPEATTTTTTEATTTTTTAPASTSAAASASGPISAEQPGTNAPGSNTSFGNVSHGTHWNGFIWPFGQNVPDTTASGNCSFDNNTVQSFTVHVSGEVRSYSCNDWRYSIRSNGNGDYTVTYTANQYQYNPPTSSVNLTFNVNGSDAPVVTVTGYTPYNG